MAVQDKHDDESEDDSASSAKVLPVPFEKYGCCICFFRPGKGEKGKEREKGEKREEGEKENQNF